MARWSNLRKLTVLAVGTGAGLAAYYYQRIRDSQTMVYNSWTTSDEPVSPCGLWDRNWDKRDPESLVRPLRDDTPEEQNRYNKQMEEARTRATRHIFLIRHGEYLDEGKEDAGHHLTDRGRLQAKFTGKRLRDLGIHWDKIVCSTMTRAEETADIILKQLDIDNENMKHCSFLREGAPIPPQPPVHSWKPYKSFFQDGARIEAGFRRYFHRACPEQKKDQYILVIGHANVIRYFVCRALQLPPEAWLRINLYHASITWLSISPSGNVSIRFLGDAGFLPPSYLTNKIPRNDKKK